MSGPNPLDVQHTNKMSRQICKLFDDLPKLEAVLKQRPYLPNNLLANGATTFLHACVKGRLDVVKLFVRYNCDVHRKDVVPKHRVNGVYHAIRSGNAELVRYLIEELGVEDNNLNPLGNTTIMTAITRKSLPIVEYLVEERNLSIQDTNIHGYNALSFAILTGSREIAEYLITKGAGLDFTDQRGNNLFVLATERGCFKMFDFLRDSGVSFTDKSNLDSRSPMVISGYMKDPRIAKWFIEAGCDINDKDSAGFTALSFAAVTNNVEVAKLLVENKASTTTQTNNLKRIPLSLAIEGGHLDVVKFLFPIRAPDTDDNFILLQAASSRSIPIFDYVLKASKQPINSKNEVNETPLLVATAENDIPMIKHIISLGANILTELNINDNDAFAYTEDVDVTKALVECLPPGTDTSSSHKFAIGARRYRCAGVFKAYTNVVNDSLGCNITRALLYATLTHRYTPSEHAAFHNFPDRLSVLAQEGHSANLLEEATVGALFYGRSSICPTLDALIRDLRQPWTISRHQKYSPAFRTLVVTIHLVANRATCSINLPIEIWRMILSFVGRFV